MFGWVIFVLKGSLTMMKSHNLLMMEWITVLLNWYMLAERKPARRWSVKTDSDDNTKDIEKLTLSQRKALKVLKATWKSLGSISWWRRSEGKMAWSHIMRQQWKEKASALCCKNIESVSIWYGKTSEITFDGVFDVQGWMWHWTWGSSKLQEP